jgi:hypothetical protein
MEPCDQLIVEIGNPATQGFYRLVMDGYEGPWNPIAFRNYNNTIRTIVRLETTMDQFD